jgi:perosamine synthetase
MRNLAFGKKNRFEHEELGWNYRISGLASALGISQLRKLPQLIEKKKKQGSIYNELLRDFDSIVQVPAAEANGSTNNYWVYGVVFQNEKIKSEVVTKLSLDGVETRPFFHPISEQPIYRRLFERQETSLKNSLFIGRCGIYLPTGRDITPVIQERIIEGLASAI